MFHKKTCLDSSRIHGIGLFADENIRKGALIYSHDKNLDLILTKKEFRSLKPAEKKFMMHHGYFNVKLKKWYLSHDNIRFCNHSAKPNMKSYYDGRIFALKDIKKGEELTENYRDFEDPIRKERKITRL